MKHLIVRATPIPGVLVIKRQSFCDKRGSFQRLFCLKELSDFIGNREIRQINQTKTENKGTVRGIHFQYPPHAELKYVSCLQGEIWDVAVDLRAGSPTFLRHFGIALTASNNLSLIIPEGVGHGYQSQTDHCEMLYLHTRDYSRNHEGCVDPLDEALGVDWPLPVTSISDRDSYQSQSVASFTGITI